MFPDTTFSVHVKSDKIEGLGKSPENLVSAKIFRKNIKNIFLHISLVNQILQLITGGMLRFLNCCLLQLFDMKL